MDTGNQRRRDGMFRNAARCGATMAMLCVLATGCSTLKAAPPNPAVTQRLAEVRAIAGPPVDSFWFERMSSFEPIGLSDLLVFTTPRDAWLLHLDGECRRLDFDPFLRLTSHSRRVSVLLDDVRVRDNPIPCQIREIRPVNATTLRHIDKEKKAQDQASGATDKPVN
jgi:hypothetical protein